MSLAVAVEGDGAATDAAAGIQGADEGGGRVNNSAEPMGQ